MSSQGGCCGGGHGEHADNKGRDTVSAPVRKDNTKPNTKAEETGSLSSDKTTAPTSTEPRAPKTGHGSCCG